jgi:hypothetical protein
MKKTTLSTIIVATMTLSAGFAHAQDAEPKINRIQLNEQVREAVQTSANEEARIRNTERHQDRISQDKQTGAADHKMEQNRNKYQERKQHEQQTKSRYDSNSTSRYGQGYESRTRSMGTFSQGSSGRQGGGRR